MFLEFTLTNEAIREYITNKYREIAKENLIIKSEIITVKKGKQKYDVVYFESPKGKIKVNVNRHEDTEL